MIPLKNIGVRMIQKWVDAKNFQRWKGTYSNPEFGIKEAEIFFRMPFRAQYAHWKKFKFSIIFSEFHAIRNISCQSLDGSKFGSFRLKLTEDHYGYSYNTPRYFLEVPK